MEQVPEHRALLGVDIVKSADNPGHLLRVIRPALDGMVEAALRTAGIDPDGDVLEWESPGDGALLTLPSRTLGQLLEAAHQLDALAAEHNRWRKPDLRLRIAVEVGPVSAEPGYYQAKIALKRMVDAPEFKHLLERCLAERGDSISTGLIISPEVWRVVYGGDYTSLVRREEFAELPIRHKEFVGSTWVRVPGFDSASIAALVASTRPVAGQVPEGRVVNQVTGVMTESVQAGSIHGGVTIGQTPR